VSKLTFLADWRNAIRDCGLDSTAKLVGLCLSTRMRRQKETGLYSCWPGKETMANDCSLSDRAVDAAVKRLEGGELLHVKRTKGGNEQTNTYTALLPRGNEVPGSDEPTGNGRSANGEPDDANGERRSQESIESDKQGFSSPDVDNEQTPEERERLVAQMRTFTDGIGRSMP